MAHIEEIDIAALAATSPELQAALDSFTEACSQVEWCACHEDKQQPAYWQDDDGSHGWDCAACGNLLQVG